MTVTTLANAPAEMKLEGVDAAGTPIALTLMLCRSLPVAIGVAVDRDQIAIGRQAVTPYHRVMPQLKRMAAMVREAVAAKDNELATMIDSDRTTMLRKLTEDIEGGRAEDLAAEACWKEGRKSVAGLIREIAERTKQAGNPAHPAELAAVITEANAELVFASLQVALEEIADPTAAT